MPEPAARPTADLAALRALLAAGEIATVQRAIVDAQQSAGDTAEAALAWGEIAETSGLAATARAIYERALANNPGASELRRRCLELAREERDDVRVTALLEDARSRDPRDPQVLSQLVEHLRRIGHLERAETVLAAAREQGMSQDAIEALKSPSRSDDSEPLMADACVPERADLVRFLDRFSGREDLHARQWYEPSRGSGYTPVHEPLTPQLLTNHVLGNVSLGVYPIRRDGKVAFCALDLDLDSRELERQRSNSAALQALRDALGEHTERWCLVLDGLGLPCLIEDSGYKGRHLWILFSEPVDAAEVWAFGKALLRAHATSLPLGMHVEFFPKQPRVRGEGIGNLIKLPLGIHRRSGRRSRFLTRQGKPVLEPWSHLRRQSLVAPAMLTAALRTLAPGGQGPPDPANPRESAEEGPGLSALSPSWTSAHFEVDAEVAHLLSGCSVLAALKTAAEEGTTISHDAQVVLRHSLGHLPQGVHAVNWLLARSGVRAREAFLQTVLSGSPVSCAKIRKRVSATCAAAGCRCEFQDAGDSYPHPLLHLRRLPAERLPASAERLPDHPLTLARAWTVLFRKGNDRFGELPGLERALAKELEARPERTLVLDGATLRLRDRDDVTELTLEPATPHAGAPERGVAP